MKLPILSHTFLSNYENCPRKAWHLYVAKDLPKEPPSLEMQAGIVAHSAFERGLQANNPDATPHPEFSRAILANAGIKHFEFECGIARTGTAVGFWTDVCWFRGKIDVVLVAPPNGFIADWKTGKPREDPKELQRFAVLLQALYPGVDAWAGAYVWLKEGRFGETHNISDTKSTFREIERLDDAIRSKPLEKEWNPTPNPLCGWCPVTTCEHWRPRK